MDLHQSNPMYTQGLFEVSSLMQEQQDQRDNDPAKLPYSVADSFLPVVYKELRLLAGSYLQSDPHHTLQPTALVHEAYLKLNKGNTEWSEKSHFVATAAIAMRQILVDHARVKGAQKRGGSMGRLDISIDLLPDDSGLGSTRDMRVLELDELLKKLASADSRAARVAELRLFGGMKQDHIAEVLDVSRTTVVNDWAFARAWLTSQAQEH